MTTWLVAAPVLIALAGCTESTSDGLGAVRDSAGIRIVDLSGVPLEPRRSLAIDSSWVSFAHLEVGTLGDVDVLDDGRVVVLDHMSAAITVVRPEGSIERTFGRPGEGPGELSPRGISTLIVTDSSVIVPDVQLQRITEFSLEGDVLATSSMADLGAAGEFVYGVDWRAHPAGGIAYRELTGDGAMILRWHRAAVDTLYVFEVAAPGPNQLLPPTPFWDVNAEGLLVIGRSDQARTELRAPANEQPVWVVRRGEEAAEVSSEDLRHLEDLILGSAAEKGIGELPPAQRQHILSSVRFPEHRPRFAAAFAAPDGRYWIQRSRPIVEMGREALRVGIALGFGGRVWEVLDPSGRLTDLVQLPGGFSPTRFAESCIYGTYEDELGLQAPARVCPGEP
ncbi:MAG: hypothetical protein ACREM1_05520 [Longimicrobiales bacterium]